jgi:L-ascorbate metabolism protein UlaG (beta-lactamase superfamily)
VLSTTFLGHQGWLFQSKAASFLVDPLLCEEFGHAHSLEYRVYPPRVFTFENFPRIDGVVLTHEHDDHFDIPSLARLERTIPIFLSSHSSIAARQILKEMGFTVHPLVPGQKVQFGDVELTPFCGDHVRVNSSDEWDTLPFFVRHLGGSGNFFSMVDITLSEQHLQWARANDSRPVVIAWTNNALDWSHMTDFLEQKNATQECFIKMGVDHKLITSTWGTPAAILVCAGGFTFDGERAWLNQRVFCVDNGTVCQQMSRLYPKEQFHVTRPGQTFLMEGHRLKRVFDDAPFLTTAPPETWPARGATAKLDAVQDYAPATGSREMQNGDNELLEQRLQEFAGSLVGGTIFKGLYSLMHDQANGRFATFALAVRTGDERRVYEYVPSACAFVRGGENPEETYLAGMECWGSDLLAILGGDLGPIALNFGRARLWNALPDKFFFDLFAEFHRVSHPLRRPAEYLRTYQRLLAKSANAAPVIFHR